MSTRPVGEPAVERCAGSGGSATPASVDDRTRWNDRYRARETEHPSAAPNAQPPAAPAPLLRLRSLLPTSGRAVDLAGGDGGAALFLADRGLSVTVVDVADVALDRVRAFTDGTDPAVTTARLDLSGRPLAEVLDAVGPPAPALVTCTNYLDRILLASVADGLPAGARFAAAIATTANLERHDRPTPRFLLAPGELEELVVGRAAGRLRLLHRREGWAEDRHRAELVVEAVGDR